MCLQLTKLAQLWAVLPVPVPSLGREKGTPKWRGEPEPEFPRRRRQLSADLANLIGRDRPGGWSALPAPSLSECPEAAALPALAAEVGQREPELPGASFFLTPKYLCRFPCPSARNHSQQSPSKWKIHLSTAFPGQTHLDALNYVFRPWALTLSQRGPRTRPPDLHLDIKTLTGPCIASSVSCLAAPALALPPWGVKRCGEMGSQSPSPLGCSPESEAPRGGGWVVRGHRRG